MKKVFLFLLLSITTLGFSQEIFISQTIKSNDIVSFKDQKLILIDFWATWCAPCIPAGKQLEVFQAQHPDKIFMISLSDESKDKINKYLKKHYIKLMVATDLEKISFKRNRIQSRPQALILNLKGKVLWKGHPSDLSVNLMNKLYKSNKQYTADSLSDVIQISEISSETKPISRFSLKKTADKDAGFYSDERQMKFSGKLSDLIGFLHEVPDYQVDIAPADNIVVSFSSVIKDREALLKEFKQHLKKDFGLNISKTEKTIRAKEIIIKDAAELWSKNQIDMGSDFMNYMISEGRIMIDNAGPGIVARLLTQVKEENYYFPKTNTGTYDWEFNYKYDQFMANEFQQSFGIEFSETKDIETEVLRIY